MMTDVNEKLLRIAVTALASDAQGGTPIDEAAIVATVQRYATVVSPGADSTVVDAVVEELTKRFNVWTGKAGTLVGNDPGHTDWLDARRPQIEWRFWNRYRMMLEASFPPRVIVELDETTDHVLGLLEDPQRPGSWRRQGLVVGHVQSGKTANYIGLVCKAADVGYKVIVVLSGIHSSLRSQTQIRLDEGFLGYSIPFSGSDSARVPVGVGLLDSSVLADSVTSRDERGDFSKHKAQGFAIHAGGNVLLFVVKKHASVLRNLIEWARLSAKKTREDGRTVVGEVPLLVIDDEADQASIDIKVQAFDEQTGQPDEEHNPSTINRLIRRLLETFERRAYVGYTATPFANVFIHPEGRTEEEGDDLFPRHFIVNLSAPSNYLGPANVFGRATDGVPPLGRVPSLVRFIDDADVWVPPRHKNTLVPRYDGKNGVPPSLEEAIRSFVLASAARCARGQETAHKSMLVHVTRFTAVQHQVHEQVRQVVEDLKTRWRARRSTPTDPLQAEMRRLWERDFIPTSVARGEDAPSWGQVEEEVWSILDRLRVNLINAKASDALVYEEHKQNGLHVIAIGGDKLSRGLTLEGLTVSYFLRSARMYDTLMQMGRWFGYRPGYEDLCRLYLSEDIAEWYGHITEAAEELRLEFDRMVLLGGTPDDYGLRVRTHPVMAITGKLRPGLPTLTTSLSATPFEPTILVENAEKARENWDLTERFLNSLGRPGEAPVTTEDVGTSKRRGSWPGSICWRHVSGEEVLQFLGRFQFADRYLTRTPSSAVKDYISDRITHGELTEWTVVAFGKEARALSPTETEPASLELQIAGHEISTIYRERQGDRDRRPGFYVVKRLGSARDEAIDLTTAEWSEVDRLRNSVPDDPQRQGEMTQGRLIREVRPRTRGLLILYLLTPEKADTTDTRRAYPIVAPYISFPYSPEAEPVSYKVSWRYWEDELAGVE